MQAATKRFEPVTERKQLYVVDDEAMLLELAKVILEPLGYDVVTFTNSNIALESFRTANPRPSLIITDYAMHEMDGERLIKEVRRLEPAQKIMMLSGTVSSESTQTMASKPDCFLAKPYHAKQLKDMVISLTV